MKNKRSSQLTFIARAVGTDKLQVGVTTNLSMRMRRIDKKCGGAKLVGYYPGNYMRTISSKLVDSRLGTNWYRMTTNAVKFIDEFMIKPLEVRRTEFCPQ